MALRYTVGSYCLLRVGLLTPNSRWTAPSCPSPSGQPRVCSLSLFLFHRWVRLCRISNPMWVMSHGIHLSLSDFLHLAYTLHWVVVVSPVSFNPEYFPTPIHCAFWFSFIVLTVFYWSKVDLQCCVSFRCIAK